MLHNTISKKVSRDTNQQNSEHRGLLKSDVDDTASVACRLRNQKLLLRLLFSLSFFFFPPVNVFQGHDCQVSEVRACNEGTLDPIQVFHFI